MRKKICWTLVVLAVLAVVANFGYSAWWVTQNGNPKRKGGR